MSLVRPAARVEIDGQALTSAEGALARVRVSLGHRAHDRAELVLWPSTKFADATPGAAMTVAMGSRDAETTVWTGELVASRPAPEGLLIEGLCATVELSRTRVSRLYLDMTIEEVVRDLASEAAVDVDEAQGDTQLEAYAVDDRRPIWDHLLDLADLSGADVSASAGGALRFVPPRPAGGEMVLRKGADLLGWRMGPGATPVPAVAAAHRAASEAGSDGWHWLRRDPAGEAGGEPVRVVTSLGNRDAADRLTEALARRAAAAAKEGVLVVTGRAALRPGDLIDPQGLSGDAGGGLLAAATGGLLGGGADGANLVRARAVEHILDGRFGFITLLRVEAAS